MQNRKFLYTLLSVLMIASMLLGINGQPAQAQQPGQSTDTSGFHYFKGKVTHADQVAAAARYAALVNHQPGAVCSDPLVGTAPNYEADYFGCYPNYAATQQPTFDANGNVVSGGVRKFVDALSGITPGGANNLGNYVSIARPDTTTYPGSDYYEIAVVEYYHKFHSDLPATKLRGYVQLETSVVHDAATHFALSYLPNPSANAPTGPIMYNGAQAYALESPQYLGATIVAQKDRPVRIKFVNLLPYGTADANGIRPGDLFIPVDESIMGAGLGPNGGTETYTQNRATLHLHGGRTPWISDGTPHQWTVPAGETTSYPKGVSTANVPDMPDPGPGAMTFYYTNQQSARLMFYHDHAYGITRLNVYAGEAAGYLLQDPTEKALVDAGVIPADIIPLVIQDKTFVPTADQLAYEDPTWNSALYGGQGALWMPHIYMPVQNPGDISGAAAMGRWQYGPWFWPIFNAVHGPVANPYFGNPGEPSVNPGTSNTTITPESFMDTPLVNGVAYPYMNVEARPYRFRILNAANDRFWNLSFFKAASNAQMWSTYGALGGANVSNPTDPAAVLLDGAAGEVPMVPALKGSTPNWPDYWTTDNREGGVPDPNAAGPDWVVIGTEGGFLPTPAVIPAQPVDYVYDRGNIVVLNVKSHSLFLGPAERADVVVDFSKFAGSTLILYNDSPAPVPAGDPRYDIYTGHPDWSYATGDGTGGPGPTVPGYGPNTRTIMQVRVAPADPVNSGLASVTVTNVGADYTNPVVTVDSVDGNGAGAAAMALGIVEHVSLTATGVGYTAIPTVTIDAPTVISGTVGITATAVATIKYGRVTGIRITNPGSGYLFAPAVHITGGNGAGAAASSTLQITEVRVMAAGIGYTTAPDVFIDDAGGIGNGATAVGFLTSGVAYDTAPLMAAFTTSAAGDGVFKTSQDPIIYPDATFNSVYSSTFPVDPFIRIPYTRTTFTTVDGTTLTINMEPKALHELFEPEFGRMNTLLAMERPNTNNTIQTTLPFYYIDPATENLTDSKTVGAPIAGDGTQIWKITHNGVDTHAIHFHLYDVQIINRVGWNGWIRTPEPFEAGWKDTVRMDPLEDTIIALRPVAPALPFGLPISKRPLDVTQPLGSTMGFSNFDPNGNPITVVNQIVSFGWEYVWHCHLLGHEENDMMRPVKFNYTATLPPVFAINYPTTTGSTSTQPVFNISWNDPTPVVYTNPATFGNTGNEIGFQVQRCTGSTCTNFVTIATVGANKTSYKDTTVGSSVSTTATLNYRYRIIAFNAMGTTITNPWAVTSSVGLKPNSPQSFVASILQPSGGTPIRVGLAWTNVTMSGKVITYKLTRSPAFTTATCDAGAGGFDALTGTCNLNAGRTSYVDSTVIAGTTYVYTLVAVNTTNGGVLSSPSTVTALPTVTPAAPTNLTGNARRVDATLNWTNNQVSPVVAGFEVWRSPNGSTGWTLVGVVQGPITTYTDTGLTPNTAYWYRVRAYTTGIPAVYSNYTPGLPGLRLQTQP